MKKLSFQLMTVVLLSVLLVLGSCTSQENDMPQPPTSEMGDLQVLKEFNDSFRPEDRTKGKPTPKGVKVGLADLKWGWLGWKLGSKIGALAGPHGSVVGGSIGAVVLGGSGSYVAYKEEEKKTRSTDTDVPDMEESIAAYILSEELVREDDYYLGGNWGIESNLVKVGILHNKALAKFGHISSHHQAIAITQLIDVEEAVVNNSEFIDVYGQLGNDSYVALVSPEEYDTRAILTSSEADRIMKLFYDGVESSVRSQEDMDQFISMYTSVVNRSVNLSEDEKASLKCGFSIMGYSFSHWSNVWPIDDDDYLID